MTRGYLLGIDAGSSVTKAAVFDAAGRQRGAGQRPVEIRRPRQGWAEIDPDAAWRSTGAAIRQALAAAGLVGADIAAVGLCGAMVGLWVVDRHGRALRPGILWEDCRAQALIDALVAADPGVPARIFRSSGSAMQQGCTLPLLAWLRANEPAVFERAAHCFSYKDYLRLRLTGRAGADRSEAAVAPGSAAGRDRNPDLLALFGLADIGERLPVAEDSESLAGTVTAEAAAKTGLVEGTPVAIGAGDVPATVIGAGGLAPGKAAAILGTACIAGVVCDRPVFEPAGVGLLFTLPGRFWFRAMVNVAGTLNLDWTVRTLLPDLAGAPDLYARLESLVEQAPVGAGGVTYLPYLSESGIIAPVVAADARAGFHGLAPRHARAHLVRAVYEGVALAIRDLLDTLRFDGDEVLLTGGGARSAMWTQMIADAVGRPVSVPAGTQSGARGAALLAATAVGLFPDVAAASAGFGGPRRRWAPNEATRAAWAEALGVYRHRRDQTLSPGAEGARAASA